MYSKSELFRRASPARFEVVLQSVSQEKLLRSMAARGMLVAMRRIAAFAVANEMSRGGSQWWSVARCAYMASDQDEDGGSSFVV